MGSNPRPAQRRLLRGVLVAAAVVAAVALAPLAAIAVHDEGLFELDGSIADDRAVAGQDWSSYRAPALAGDTAPISTVFISDGFDGVDDTIYFGGGSQNNNDIPSWQWSCGGVSTKSDIEHAFAAAYVDDGQLFLYFGADRYDPTGGTTNVGFWFLQAGGALRGGSGCPDADGAMNTFSGQHADGDLFVFAEFSGGGGDSAVSIYEWRGGGLYLLSTKSAGSFCSSDDSICARTNDQTIDSTWAYRDNQGTSPDGQILQGGFVEGGINLSSIYARLGKELPCVNRFLAQTGSSHPDTGVLEDFAGGAFDVCSKLIVDKATPSGDPTRFQFGVSGPNGYADSFQLADGDAPHDSGQIRSGTYYVTEAADAAIWSAPSVSCSDQWSNDVPYGANGAVEVAPGVTVTCTFTNRKRGRLTVVKKIVGGNGATDAFDVGVDGSTRIDDAASLDPSGTSSGAFAVSAGTHSVSETLADGSTPVDGSLWAVAFSGDCDSSGNVDVQPDESKTCTITNAKRPKLAVVKRVEGGDGSTFDISVGPTKVLDDARDGARDERAYEPGSYRISETFGDGGAIGPDWSVVYSGDCDVTGSVTLAYGDAKTCTITNRRKPKLTVVKQIVGGDGSTFDIAVGPTKVLDDARDAAADTRTYAPGTYAVTETLGDGQPIPAGWTTSYGGSCVAGSVTLAYGDEKTCTITNSKLPTLTVIKRVVGGARSPRDFRITVSGNGPTPGSFDGSAEGTVVTLHPGAYDVSEREDALYAVSYSAGCKDGTLAYGESKTCAITNTRKPSGIAIEKVAAPGSVPEPGGPVTFTLVIRNLSAADAVTVTGLRDSVYGDLFGKGDCDALEDRRLAASDGAAGGLDETTCSFTAMVSGDAGDRHRNVATVRGRDEEDRPLVDEDFADVVVADVVPSIEVTKSADPETLPEPGGRVDFTVRIGNTGVASDPVTITSLVDDPDGSGPAEPIDLDGLGSCDVPQTIAPGAAYTCRFTRTVAGNAGEAKTDVVTASGRDGEGNEVADLDDATVTLTDVPSSITLEKAADPTSIREPGGRVTFTVAIANTSKVDRVTIDALDDDVYGNLTVHGSCGTLIGTVLRPDDGAAGGPDEASCAFTASVTGIAGSTHRDVVTVSAHDDDGRPLTARDDAIVAITAAPRLIDLYVTKTGLPDPVELNGRLTYTIVVANNGADAATRVALADPLPAGTSFVSVSSSQGSCTGGALVSCDLGTIARGATVTITLVVSVQQPGLVANTVTVVGAEPEANPVDNEATATTVVTAPAAARPPNRVVCYALSVKPKSLRVGRRAIVSVRVTEAGRPVPGRPVRVRGAGIARTARTNGSGVVRIVVRPRRPGILTVTVPQTIACDGRRIGVVGAFEPPVTG